MFEAHIRGLVSKTPSFTIRLSGLDDELTYVTRLVEIPLRSP